MTINLDFAQSAGKARKTPFFGHLQEAIAPLFKAQYNLDRVLSPGDSFHGREIAYLARGWSAYPWLDLAELFDMVGLDPDAGLYVVVVRGWATTYSPTTEMLFLMRFL
ncbi:MAG: hypothetical protein GXO55_03910 [Chloroflexi bacterium]|nr:hypothetical protein [Chloroflexota bacterium]